MSERRDGAVICHEQALGAPRVCGSRSRVGVLPPWVQEAGDGAEGNDLSVSRGETHVGAAVTQVGTEPARAHGNSCLTCTCLVWRRGHKMRPCVI